MSDFVTELRREVVGAHATHRRSTARTRRRRWRPVLAGAVTLAAVVAAIVFAVHSLPAPEPSAGPRVTKVVHLGGIPIDGVLGAGSLWIADSVRSQVDRLDPRTGHVRARIPVGLSPEEIASGPAGVWVRGPRGARANVAVLAQIDPRADRVARRSGAGAGTAVAVGTDELWVSRRFEAVESIDRIDLQSGRVSDRITFARTDGLALAGGTLWAVGHDGTVARIDAARARIEHRWPELAPSDASADSSDAIVADARGAWVLSTDQAAIFRLEGNRIVRRLPVPGLSQPLLARTPGALWVASGDQGRGFYTLSRIDPRRGGVTAVVNLGSHRPQALVPTAGGLWVVGGDGTAVLIHT
jgi:hypothetical protein